MVKRAIYDVPTRSGKENREIAIERFFPLQQKTRERDEDFQDFATLNACVFGFRLSGKRTTPQKLLLSRLGGVRTRTPSREAAARQTPPVCVKGG